MKKDISIPPLWRNLLISVLITAFFILFRIIFLKWVAAGKATLSWRTDPLGCILLGFIAIIYSGRSYTLHDKYIVCRVFGIPYRKLYWVEFSSGIAIRRGKDGSGEEGKLVVLLTLRGTPDFDPKSSAGQKGFSLDQAVSKYASSHPIGVIKIVIHKKDLEEQCITAFSAHCPNFRVIPDTSVTQDGSAC